jgi:diguanylate cyclase (GGDEF)-like protein/PAS domain S-box-containing protein
MTSSTGEHVKLLRAFAENVPAKLAYYDENQVCRFANESYAATFGLTAQTIVGHHVRVIAGEAVYTEITPHVKKAYAGEKARYERELILPNGAARVHEIELWPDFDDDGKVIGVYLQSSDITRFREQEERLRKFADAVHDGIFVHEGGLLTDVNPALLQLIGHTREEMLGRSTLEFVPPEHHEFIRAYIAEERESPYQTEILHRDGYRIAVEMRAASVLQRGVRQRLGVLRDIRAQLAAEERIRFFALQDPLTGLPNRSQLDERLNTLLALARRNDTQAAVLFIDLDNFKTVNDSLGHAVGDSLLVETARRLREAVRDSDVVARLGGDEFVILLPSLASGEDAARVSTKIIDALSTPMESSRHTLRITPSIGIAMFPRDGEDADTLLRHADSAMYSAKAHGRNAYQFYTPVLERKASGALLLERELRDAITRDELWVAYQPQFVGATGILSGLEALVRWKHPVRGQVGPNDFIKFAEERGLIDRIGELVLRKTVEQAAQWQHAGLLDVPVAVNVSALQFLRGDFAWTLRNALMDFKLDASLIDLEVTENALMDSASAGPTLHRLASLGVGIVIDDFGTGYSSLAYLSQYSVDKLKIDQSFVHGLFGEDDGNRQIVQAIIDLAHRLRMRVLAEGVESAPQLNALRAWGCDEYQGFFGARPMNAEACTQFLTQRRAH